MKFIQKGLLVVLFLFLVRGPLYRLLFSYQSLGERTVYTIRDAELKEYINRNTADQPPANVREVIQLALRLTADQLHFAASRTRNDPNQLIRTRRAHCVGYAAFFSTICNQLLTQYGFGKEWKAQPLIGQIHFLGINVHTYLDTPFFRDHDFNRITNLQTGEAYFVDPTIHDYGLIDLVTSAQ